ncbi:MAG: CBS domain-containing protein [Candidatus Hodarchaeota archaeon]
MLQTIKELMVPIDNYVTVNEDITVGEALTVLQQIRDKYQTEGRQYKPRQLIVLDKDNRVVGRLDQMDVVISLEPKYRTKRGTEAIKHISASGISPELLTEMMQWYSLWGETFEERCKKVITMSVKDCMRSPRRDEYIAEGESMETAVHHMVMGRHIALLVTRNDEVVGILRLSDIFDQIAHLATSR